jgi:hypothetical protein
VGSVQIHSGASDGAFISVSDAFNCKLELGELLGFKLNRICHVMMLMGLDYN